MIRTFGDVQRRQGQQKAHQTNDGVSEELRDEQYSQKLREAFELKQNNRNQESLNLYQEVLNQEFLKESNVDKHIFMRFNAFKNMGELHERLGMFKEAKNSYTMALKIKDKDPFLWTRLGYLQFDVFKDLALAKKCLEAAAHTCTTFEKRSSRINLILMRLAEIYFMEFDYKKSEEMIDAILQRQDSKCDQNAILFAFVMKSFYLGLRNDQNMSLMMMQKARVIKPTVTFNDFEILKQFNQQISQKYQTKDIAISVMKQTEDGKMIYKYDYLKLTNLQHCIKINPDPKISSFMECFDDFLLQMTLKCESTTQANGHKILYNSILDSNDYDTLFQTIAQQDENMILLNQKRYENAIAILESKLNSDDILNSQSNTSQSNQQSQQNKKQTQAQAARSERMLRKKPDSSEQQLKQYNLKPLKDFKEVILDQKRWEDLDDRVMPLIFSNREIINSKAYFQQQVFERNSQSTEQQQQQNDMQMDQVNSQQSSDFNEIGDLYNKLWGCQSRVNQRGILFALKNILRFMIESEEKILNSMNIINSSILYRIFIQFVGNDFCRQNLESIGSFQVLLTLFEMSLFNKQVIKHVKSNALIQQREKMFDYFTYKEQEIIFMLEQKQQKQQCSMKEIALIEKIKIRYYYTMMFYSFEIKNNMHASINYFQRLDLDYLKQEGQIQLPWLGSSFIIDERKVIQYGNCKIKEAQVVRDFDENLMQLKLKEVKQLEEQKKQQNTSRINKISPEFIKFAYFYLDQFCQYMQKAYQSESSVNANFSTNEEKIKEMWGKLQYTMCRSPTSILYKITSHLFSILTAFQYLHKQFYEQFVLKKLDFEPIFTELQDRLKLIFQGVNDYQRENQIGNLVQLKPVVLQSLKNNLEFDEQHALSQLLKMQVHLLRIMTSEFLFYHVISNVTKLMEVQQLLMAYFQNVFFIEVFISILRAKPEEDLADQLRSVIHLIKCFDKLSLRNNEVFIKAYFRTLAISYPFLLGLFSNHLEQNTHLKINNAYLIDQNDLMQLIIALSAYFFDIKFSFKELTKQQSVQIQNTTSASSTINAFQQQQQQQEEKKGDENENEEGEDDDDSEDEKKKYKLKCLQRMREKANKYWNLHLAQQTKNAVPQLGIMNQQLGWLHQTGVIDLDFLQDLTNLCNSLCFDRLFQCGEVTYKDISSIVVFVDTVAKYFMENIKSFTENCILYKDQMALFKNFHLTNPLMFITNLNQYLQNPANCQCQGNSCIQTNKRAKEQVQRILFFLLNISSHLTLESCPYQIVKVNQKRKIIESLGNLSGQGKLLKNLRSLSNLDIVISGFGIESLIIYSQVQSEFFSQANNSKLYMDYKTQENYISFKKLYHNSQNALLMAIQSIFTLLRDSITNIKALSNQYQWSNLNIIGKLKYCLTQMLQIVLQKIQSYKFLLKQKYFSYDQDLLAKKAAKLFNLNEQALVLCIICEKLEKLNNLQEDPRIGQGKPNDILSRVLQMIESFLEAVQRSQSTLSDKVRFQITSEFKDDLISKLNSLLNDYKNRMDQCQRGISFEYIYLQAVISKRLQKLEQKQRDIVSQFRDIKDLNKSLETALINSSLNGCIESFIKLLNRGIQLTVLLKYSQQQLSTTEFNELKQIHESLVKNILGERQAYKFIMASLMPMYNNQASKDKMDETLDVALDQASASLKRAEIFKTNQMPEFNAFENILFQLFKSGDQLYQILSLANNLYVKSRLQYTLTKALHNEILVNPIEKVMIEEHILQNLAEMLQFVFQGIQTQEEQDNPINPYIEDYKKNIVTTLKHSKMKQTDIRIQLKTYYLELNEKCCRDEKIKEIYKKYQNAFKQFETKGKDQYNSRTIEMNNLFAQTKDKYISTLKLRIDRQLEMYTQSRKLMISTQGQKNQEIAKNAYKDLRDKYSVTKDNIPSMLRDIFEIFVDSHMKKSFISQRKLIDEFQKRIIRQCVLKVCAFCGPDPDFESNKITSKFLDLARITDEDYEYEALTISIKWFLLILEERQNKKEQDFTKKLKATFEEIERAVKEQNAMKQATLTAMMSGANGGNIDMEITNKVFAENENNNI